MMKSYVFTDTRKLEIMEKELPEDKEGHSILKIDAIGICGTDIHGFNGTQAMFSYPRIVGHEIAASIESSRKFKKNRKVTVIPYLSCGTCIACRNGKENACTDLSVLGVHIDGGMQEYISVPDDYIIAVDNMSSKQRAMVEPLSISEHAVSRGEIKPGDWIVVSGIGPIGMGIIVMAKYRKANVIAIDMNEKRLKFAKEELNADFCLKANENLASDISEITRGDMATTILDATGNPESMDKAVDLLASGGTIIFVGFHKQNIHINNLAFHKRESTIKGSRAAYKHDFEAVIRMIQSGFFDPEKLLTTVFSPQSFVHDFEKFTRDKDQIKAVVMF